MSSISNVGVQFSPDGSEVVTTNNDGGVDIFRVATHKIVATFSARGTTAVNAAFSPDGKQIVAGYEDGTVRVWDVATKLQLTLLAGHTGQINSVQFSPDGGEIATASQDGTIRVWYAEPRELRAEFTAQAGNGELDFLYKAGYVSDRIITAELSGNIFVYSASGKLQATIKPGFGEEGASWNRAGTKILMVTYGPASQGSGAVELWHAVGSSYALQHTFGPYSSGIDEADISPDGSRFAVVTDDTSVNSINSFTNAQLVIWVRNTDTGKLIRKLHAVKSIQAVAFNPDGQQIVGLDVSGQIEVWNGTATRPRVLGSPGPNLGTVSFNQSGSEFAFASANGVITVWNAHDGRVLTLINACPSPGHPAFSPDGSKIAVDCSDGTARVFDAGTGQPLTVIQATSAGDVVAAMFSPDGTSIVVGVSNGNTGEIQIWNAELATSSLPTLERIGEQRLGDRLTAAQLQQYLSGASS